MAILASAAPQSNSPDRRRPKSTKGEHDYTITDGNEVEGEFAVFSSGQLQNDIHLLRANLMLHDILPNQDSDTRVVDRSSSIFFPDLLGLQSERIVSGPARVVCRNLLVDQEPLPDPDSFYGRETLETGFTWPYTLPFDISPMVVSSMGVLCVQQTENAIQETDRLNAATDP